MVLFYILLNVYKYNLVREALKCYAILYDLISLFVFVGFFKLVYE